MKPRKTSNTTLLLLAGSLMLSGGAHAADPALAEQIGTKYLPWGAEKAGNAAGTIPAYEGPPAVPKTYDPAKPGVRPDPFADEQPLFVIDKSNMDKYADNLAEGIKQMLVKYPAFKLNVYKTHRTASYPDFYLENSKKNAASCKTTNDGLALEGCYAGLPFPFPKSGAEVMWNRLLKYDQYSYSTAGIGIRLVPPSGPIVDTGSGPMYAQAPIFDPERKEPLKADDVYTTIRNDWRSPARKVGESTLIRDAIDMANIGRRAWSYFPGQRRVRLAPDLSYDTPGPAAGGAAIIDETSVFFGPLDRFDFKLLGKKEIFIPYNAYKGTNPESCPESKALSTRNHLNPECMRWELHRVWVVEATLKPGARHIYRKRMFYWDEDLPGVGIGVGYDGSGEAYRVTHSMPITAYEAKGHFTDEWVNHDLQSGAYLRVQDATMYGGWIANEPKPNSFFNSAALAAGGIR